MQNTKNRYPGIRFFERGEQHLFFGRKKECLDLYSMLKVKPLIVLFAKSGIGKSSLINAGLEPMIEKNGFLPIYIRLQDTSVSPITLMEKAFSSFHNVDLFEKHAGRKHTEVRLWEYIRACNFEKNGETLTPVLIFDQFEEFFNHDYSKQKDFVHTLANLVNNRMPDEVQDQMRNIPRRERTREQLSWFDPIPVKVLISIRSDRISLLDELSVEIPTILRDRYHLKALNKNQAKDAIVKPAALPSDDFMVKPFDYQEETLEEILDHLSNQNEEIESFQLQILCREIEREVWKRQQKML